MKVVVALTAAEAVVAAVVFVVVSVPKLRSRNFLPKPATQLRKRQESLMATLNEHVSCSGEND